MNVLSGMGSRNTGRSVPLQQYMEQEGCGLLVTCLACQHGRRVEIAPVIARLQARGVRVADVGIQDAARYIRGGCPTCGGERFSTTPAWPLREGMGRTLS